MARSRQPRKRRGGEHSRGLQGIRRAPCTFAPASRTRRNLSETGSRAAWRRLALPLARGRGRRGPDRGLPGCAGWRPGPSRSSGPRPLRDGAGSRRGDPAGPYRSPRRPRIPGPLGGARRRAPGSRTPFGGGRRVHRRGRAGRGRLSLSVPQGPVPLAPEPRAGRSRCARSDRPESLLHSRLPARGTDRRGPRGSRDRKGPLPNGS